MRVLEVLVILVGRIILGSSEKEPKISKKFETELSVSDFNNLILKSPRSRIRGLFSLLAFYRRGRIYPSLHSSIDMQGCLYIQPTIMCFFLFVHDFNKNRFQFFTFVEVAR